MTDDKGRELLAQSIAQATRTSLDFTLAPRPQPKPAAPRLDFHMADSTPVAAIAQPAPTQSPTGTAVIPQVLVRAAAAVVGMAGVLVQTLPNHTVAWRVSAFIVSIGGALGIMSQGVRAKA